MESRDENSVWSLLFIIIIRKGDNLFLPEELLMENITKNVVILFHIGLGFVVVQGMTRYENASHSAGGVDHPKIIKTTFSPAIGRA